LGTGDEGRSGYDDPTTDEEGDSDLAEELGRVRVRDLRSDRHQAGQGIPVIWETKKVAPNPPLTIAFK